MSPASPPANRIQIPTAVVGPLQVWAGTELRDLPWRHTRDPWHVLVSEVMLQQTQVGRVIDRYLEFLGRFPDANACAEAPVAAVIELWSGLGYNRRAVNLWRAAKVVADKHGGLLPNDLAELLALPGLGPYTARAVLVFAFDQDIGVVDTNVGRLLARWTGQSLSTRQAQQLADQLVPVGDGWRWNQALFDFAVAVCTKREPGCGSCPLATACRWSGRGPDPAAKSAGVSTAQSAFEGSQRQVRGRIVDALRAGPLAVTEIGSLGRSTDSHDEVLGIVDGLVADGLAERTGEFVQLPR